MSTQRSGRDDPRFRQIDSFDQYLGTDLARTHGFTSAEAAGMDAEALEREHAQLMRDGFVILHDMVSSEQMDQFDDGFYPWPRPRPALSVATVFAIDEFTPDKGATVAIPGSHLWGEDRFPEDGDERVQAVMPAGSCILFLGNLWHGGGENHSGSSRLAITAQYCEPWVRT